MPPSCPICQVPSADPFRAVAGYQYYRCRGCGSLFIEPRVIEACDGGCSLVRYSDGYWVLELRAARQRAWGPALARVAELFLYARRPIARFVDIGTGPGYLLDALSTYLPASADKFFGIEKYPPPERSQHPNYRVGTLTDLDMRFDAGCCIEVLEHLTPRMASELLRQLAARSFANAAYIFNTGLPQYVVEQDPGYLDPLQRGHIVSYSLQGVAHIAEPHGFSVKPIPGKTWAFLLEYASGASQEEDVRTRIWSACPENVATLNDPVMGGVLHVLGLDTARAY
jgi:hypothetical protein